MKGSNFKYIDLFAGIGGFSFAAKRLGGELVFASEIDRFASEAFEAIHGTTPSGDITKIDAEDVPDHDLILGGFPCQAFSVAGRRRGLEDARGTLFFDIARIAEAKQPKAMVLENVKGLINHDKGRTFELMLTMLNEIGYVVDFEVLNSKYFGVPQNRERVFIIAVRSDLIDTEPWEPKGSTLVPKAKRRLADKLDIFNVEGTTESGEAKKLRDVLEPEVDESFYLSEDKTAKLIAELEEKSPGIGHHPFSKKYEFRGYSDTSPALIATDYKAPKTVLDRVPDPDTTPKGPERGSKLGFLPTPEGINNTLRSGGAGSLTAKHCYDHIAIPAPREPKITNIEVIGHTGTGGQRGRVISGQGLSPCLSATESKQPTQIAVKEATKRGYAVATVGDSVNMAFPDSKTRRGRVGKQLSHTIEASNNEIAVVVEEPPIYKWRIRKLTPLECWRLQGFPDEAHEAVKAHGISNTQRYKQAGNAVTVNVVESVLNDLINTGIFLL